jgi:hypothetical protein
MIPVTFCKENNNCVAACGVGSSMTDAAQDIIGKANSIDPSIGWAGVLGCGITSWGDFINRRSNSDISGKCGLGILRPYDESVAVRIGLCGIGHTAGGIAIQPQVYQVVQCPPGHEPLPTPSSDNPSCSGAETYSITLFGLGSIEPGVILNASRVKVLKDRQPAPGVQVQIAVDVVARSGGHDHHDAGRPKGTLSVHAGTTGADGTLPFTFTAPASAGDHVITARCVNQDCGQATGMVWVGYKDLQPLPPSPNYALVGATGTHSDNHYLTDAAITKLNELVASYRARFPNAPLLHLNDASLERGGIFDIKANWTPPHHEHRRGTVIDIRVNDAPGTIPARNYKAFTDIAGRIGMNAKLHSPGTSNQHFHVRLMGVGE